MLRLKTINYRNKCVTSSLEPPCAGYQATTFPPGGPVGVLPFNAYAGPSTVEVPLASARLTFPDTLMLMLSTWYALSNLTTNTFLLEANTTTSSLTTGGFSTGTEFISSLPAGTYNISFSLTLFPGENDVGIIAAIGTHTAGTPPTGTPIFHPLISDRPAIQATASAGTTQDRCSLSAEGGITLTTPLSNVGIIFKALEAGKAFEVGDVQLKITRLE